MAEGKWTPETIRGLISSSTKMVERSILVLYARQTLTEQRVGETAEHNKMGFTGCDAGLLSSFAKQIGSSTYPEGKRLSPKQLYYARKKLFKYAGQLAVYANTKDALEIEQALGTVTPELFRKGGTFTPPENCNG